MSSEPFVGEIMMWGGNFAPRGWAFCDGQLLPISQNTALFSLLGTTYGGDGKTTFALPDLRGRVPIGTGTGNGLTTRTLGQAGGAESAAVESVTVTQADEGGTVDAAAPPEGNAVPTMPPYLPVSFVISLWGVYPSRS